MDMLYSKNYNYNFNYICMYIHVYSEVSSETIQFTLLITDKKYHLAILVNLLCNNYIGVESQTDGTPATRQRSPLA